MEVPRGFRVFIAKHPCDGLPFIQETDPDPRDDEWDASEDYSGWYVKEDQ